MFWKSTQERKKILYENEKWFKPKDNAHLWLCVKNRTHVPNFSLIFLSVPFIFAFFEVFFSCFVITYWKKSEKDVAWDLKVKWLSIGRNYEVFFRCCVGCLVNFIANDMLWMGRFSLTILLEKFYNFIFLLKKLLCANVNFLWYNSIKANRSVLALISFKSWIGLIIKYMRCPINFFSLKYLMIFTTFNYHLIRTICGKKIF